MLRHSIVLVLLAGISALASSVGADDEQSIKRPQARRIVSGPLPFQSHFQDRRSGNGPRDGRRPRPSLPAPPYAVQMEPLVQYSQRDPLYHQKNAINITASNDNKISLARADSQPESTNSISDTLNNLSEAQNRYDNPYPAHYYKEPEPIIEIIIKESNESLPAPPTPAPVHQLPPKKEPVQVFYIKYKKNPNSYGKNGEDDIIYEPPVPALTPPPGELEGETEHQSQLAHSPTPAPPPPPPPPSTTLRTIIHPDSEVFHGSGLHVTFGESETHYSDAEQEEQSAPEPSISLPTSQVPSAQNRESSGAQIKRQQQFPPYTPLQPGTYQTPPPPPSSQSSFQQPSQPSSFVKEQFPRQISQHQKPAFRPQHTSGLLSQPHPPQNHASPSQAPQFEQTFQQQPKFQQSAQQIQLRHNHQQQQQQQRQPNNQHFNSNLQTHSQGNTVRSQNVRPNQPPQQFQHTAQQTHQTQRPFYKPNDQPPRQHFHQPLAQATHQHTQPLHQSELASPSNNVQYSQFRSQPIHVQAQPNSFQQPQHHHHTQVEQKNQHTQFNQLQGQRQGITQAHFQQPQLSQQSNYASINQDHSKHQQSPSSQASFANIQPSSHVQQPTSVNFPAAIRQRPKSPLQIEFERQQQQRLQQLQQPQQQQNSQQELNPQQQQHQQQQQQQYKQHQHQLQQHQQQQHHQSLQQQQYQQQQQSISNLQQPKQNHNNLQQYQAQPQFNAQQQPQYHVNQQKQTQVRPSQSQQFQGNQPQSQQLSNYKPIQNQHQQAIVPQQSHFNSQPTPSSSGEIVKSIPKLEEHQVQPTPQPSPVYYESNQQSFSNNQRKVPQKSAHRHNQLEQQGIKYNKEPVYTTQSPFVSPTTVITPKPFKTYSHQPSSTTAQSIPQNEEIDEEQSEKILYERREKEKKKHEQNVAALPSEVPDDLREQLLQSGILGNADIQILDYDKVGDIPIESLPPEALENLYGAGSAPVPAVATPDDTAPKTPVEMKVVRYDPTTKEGQSLAETYVKEDATQLDPVVLNDSRYNRYLPLKVNGTNFPLPDAPQLDGRIINSVVVLAPVDYDFVHPPDPISDGDRDGRSTPIQVQGVRFIAGDILKDLVKEPTADNYVSWLEKEKSTPTDRQSVVLLVTSLSNSKENGKEKEIFMYDVNSTRISKLRGELSSAFVDVAESNAQSQDLDGLSSATNEEEVEETEAAASEFQSYKIASPVYQPENIKLAGFSNRDIDLAMSASEPELQQVDQDTTNFGDKISILSGYSRMKEY